MHCFALSRGEFSVSFMAENLGDDICIIVSGGRRHIGAVALSVARPSLKADGTNSSSTSVLAMTGHKDDAVAKYISEHLANNLNKNVVVVCGIHYDDIDCDGIDAIMGLTSDGAKQLCETLCARP
jgi:hypothetical protein